MVGYAHLDPMKTPLDSSAGAAAYRVGEVYVRPDMRRRGVGGALVAGLLDRIDTGHGPRDVRLWAFGEHPAAAALARSCGFHRVREVLRMRLPLSAALAHPALPDELRLRTFRPDHDEAAVVEVNRRAFSWHPEQGDMTVDDLRAARSEPWFDPAGFFLVVDASDTVLGFHWTKVHPDVDGGPVGEVYVLGVDPQAQRRGVGRALTLAGLRYFVEAGLDTAMLYVEADNEEALATYRKLGFAVWDRDVQYARFVDAGDV